MKRLPDSELELMMIIWTIGHPVSRLEIEERMTEARQISPTTVLSFLARLEEKGFLKVEKEGKTNIYTALISYVAYSGKESRNTLQKMYGNSIKNFVAALYEGDGISSEELKELQAFIEQKMQEK